MLPIHERMAELWMIQKTRKLTKEENDQMSMCMYANATYCYNRAKLQNLSLAAAMTGDAEWQHEICTRIEELEGQAL